MENEGTPVAVESMMGGSTDVIAYGYIAMIVLVLVIVSIGAYLYATQRTPRVERTGEWELPSA